MSDPTTIAPVLAEQIERLRQISREKAEKDAEREREVAERRATFEWREEHALSDRAFGAIAHRIEATIPPRYRDALITDPQVDGWLTDVLLGSGDGLLLLGATGRGKTHLAYAAVRAYIAAHCSMAAQPPAVVVGSLPALLAQARPGGQPQMKRDQFGDSYEVPDAVTQFSTCRLLFVDDVGAEKPSDWTTEVIYRVIDYRYNHLLPTIVASNLAPRDLAGVIGDRLASRLTEMCRAVVIKGDDRRRAA